MISLFLPPPSSPPRETTILAHVGRRGRGGARFVGIFVDPDRELFLPPPPPTLDDPRSRIEAIYADRRNALRPPTLMDIRGKLGLVG